MADKNISQEFSFKNKDVARYYLVEKIEQSELRNKKQKMFVWL